MSVDSVSRIGKATFLLLLRTVAPPSSRVNAYGIDLENFPWCGDYPDLIERKRQAGIIATTEANLRLEYLLAQAAEDKTIIVRPIWRELSS